MYIQEYHRVFTDTKEKQTAKFSIYHDDNCTENGVLKETALELVNKWNMFSKGKYVYWIEDKK